MGSRVRIFWGLGYAAGAAAYKSLNAEPMPVHLSPGGGQRTLRQQWQVKVANTAW